MRSEGLDAFRFFVKKRGPYQYGVIIFILLSIGDLGNLILSRHLGGSSKRDKQG